MIVARGLGISSTDHGAIVAFGLGHDPATVVQIPVPGGRPSGQPQRRRRHVRESETWPIETALPVVLARARVRDEDDVLVSAATITDPPTAAGSRRRRMALALLMAG